MNEPASGKPLYPNSEKKLQRSVLEEQKDLYLKKIQESEKRLEALKNKKQVLEQSIEEKVQQKQDQTREEKQKLRRTIMEHLLRGRAHYRSGHYEQALKEWEAILLLDEQHVRAQGYIADCEKQIEASARQQEIQEEIQQQKERERLESLYAAKKKYREGRYEEAIEIIEKTTTTHGTSPELQNVLSACESRLREIESELIRARKESQQHQQEVARYLNLGRQFARKGEHSRALELYEKCLLIEPDNKVAQEELKRSELLLRTEEEENRKQTERTHRLVMEKKIQALRFVRENQYLKALTLLEDLLLQCPQSYHPEIMEQIREYESKYEATRTSEETENRCREEQEIKEKKEKDQIYLETMFQVEACLMQENYREALLLLRKLQIDFPDRQDLAEKLTTTQFRVDQEAERRRLKSLSSEEERQQAERLLGEAVSLYYQGRLDASLEKLTEVLKLGHYGMHEARDLIRKIESRQQERRDAMHREHEEAVQGSLGRFKQALARENMVRARTALEELKVQCRLHPEAAVSLGPCETELVELEQRLKREKSSAQDRFRDTFNRGIQLYRAGNYAEAYLNFKEAAGLNPGDQDVHRFRMAALDKYNRDEKQTEETRRQEEAFALDYQTLHREVRTFLQQQDFQKAIEAYETLLLKFPGQARLRTELRDLEEQSEEYRKEAALHQEEAQRQSRIQFLSRKASRYFFQNQFAEALSACQEVLALQPENKAVQELRDRILNRKQEEDLVKKQEQEVQENERQHRKAMLEQKYEARMTELKAIHEAGLNHYREGRLEEAILEWQKGLILDPAHPVLSEEIRRTKREIREKEIAAVQEQEMRTQKEVEMQGLWRRGRMLVLNSRFLEGIELLDQALALVGTHDELQKEIEKAEKQFVLHEKRRREEQEVESRQQESIQNHLFMAHRYFNNEQYPEAIDAFEKILELNPAHQEARDGILLAEEELRGRVQKPLRGIGRSKARREMRPPRETTPPLEEEPQEKEPASSPAAESLEPAGPSSQENTGDAEAGEEEKYEFLENWRAQDETRERRHASLKNLKKELSDLYHDARALSREQKNAKAMQLLEKGLEDAEQAGIDNFTVRRMRKLYEHLVRWS